MTIIFLQQNKKIFTILWRIKRIKAEIISLWNIMKKEGSLRKLLSDETKDSCIWMKKNMHLHHALHLLFIGTISYKCICDFEQLWSQMENTKKNCPKGIYLTVKRIQIWFDAEPNNKLSWKISLIYFFGHIFCRTLYYILLQFNTIYSYSKNTVI